MGPFRTIGAAIAARARVLAGDEKRALGLILLGGFLVTLTALALSGKIALDVLGNRTQAFDEDVLREIGAAKERLGERRPKVDQLFVDLSALGGWVALSLLSTFATVYLWLCRRRWDALIVVVVSAGGVVLNQLLKHAFARPRPSIFEHGNVVDSGSFPSGHSMMSMAIYLAHGALLARLAPTRLARAFALTTATVLPVAIACSRMYLGVHYPTDVAAGLLLGLAWALTALCAAEVVRLDVRETERALS